ncbi:DUF4145 domain-containing protein [Leptospira yasudae]|uniref:DUF4145 domain-containing protein n=1 Tax=Leptospira yasudae TaxID=2202201 RepID=UPI001083F204|nr:DUF4145 domain-containing protein [Leptospira yasudae]TGK23571.1 DUF4145 domain-containing protein [Leptospira yasudae]TGM01023.1 DUF4145 domain-containing protein [Leptospira yasudae]
MDSLPEYKSNKFKCPHCNVNSQQVWFDSSSVVELVNESLSGSFLDYRLKISSLHQDPIKAFGNFASLEVSKVLREHFPKIFSISICQVCKEISIWVSQQLIYPQRISIALPNEDMSDEIKSLYNEAAEIFKNSPRGAAALLRLALQKLLIQLGKKGKSINDDIKELVSEGLSSKVQQALDLVRVVGNNAVHPGQIDLEDNINAASVLFRILNFIAEELISKPKDLENLYNSIIPEETRKHIEKRDGG